MSRRGSKVVIPFPGANAALDPLVGRALSSFIEREAAKVITLPVIRIETEGWLRQEREMMTKRP